MNKILLLILIIGCVHNSECSFKVNLSDEKGVYILRDMIQRQLKQLPLTVISPKPELVPRSILQLGIQSRLITNISNIPELLVDDKGHYMIIAECLDDLDMVLSEFEKTGKWHSTSKFFIFLQNDEDLESIAEIFKKLWKLYIYNAVATTDFINFYTWFPYAINNNCGREFHLKECPRKNSFDPFANKIPNKVNNCEFNVTMAIVEMYTDENTNEGFINAYIDIICEKLNMSPKFLPRNYVKYIEESGNLNLIPEEMENNDIQAAQVVLLFDKRLPCNFCQYTWSILDTNLYFAVPFRKKLPTKILEILPNNVKISYIFIAILFVITWKFINKVTWQRSIFDITQLLVTVQTTRRCMRRSANCLLILIFWYGLIMNTVYSTGLGSILTRPELSPKIQTLEQLLDSDYRIASNIMSMQFIEESDPDKALKIKERVIEGSMEIPYPETIRRFMKNPDHSIGIITNTFWQIRNLKDIEIILDDPVVKSKSVFIIRRNHPLFDKINNWILSIQEAGLPSKWVRKYTANMEKFEIEVENEGRRKLNMVDMHDSFMFLIVGNLFSFCVFMIESAYYRMSR